MTQLCEVTYTDKDTGHVRNCQNGTPEPSVRKFGGMPACAVCLEDLIGQAIVKSGASRRTVLTAAKLAGSTRVVNKLTNLAAKKSGKSRQQIDQEIREAQGVGGA